MNSFLLFAPDFWHGSAGIRALYMLGDYLKELGHKVYHLNYTRPIEHKTFPAEIVCIMPETCPIIVPEVPVIRWALNHPGKLGGPTQYGANEFVIHWDGMEETAAAAAHNGRSHELTLGVLDDVFPIDTPLRDLHLWYEGKGKSDGYHPEDALRMTRTWPPTRKEVINLLSRCYNFYSYDDFSAINLEAHICGCNVFIRREEKWEKYSPPENYEKFLPNKERDRANVAAMLDLFKAECQ